MSEQLLDIDFQFKQENVEFETLRCIIVKYTQRNANYRMMLHDLDENFLITINSSSWEAYRDWSNEFRGRIGNKVFVLIWVDWSRFLRFQSDILSRKLTMRES